METKAPMLVKSSIRDTTSKAYSKRKSTKKKGYKEEDLTIFVEWMLPMRRKENKLLVSLNRRF